MYSSEFLTCSKASSVAKDHVSRFWSASQSQFKDSCSISSEEEFSIIEEEEGRLDEIQQPLQMRMKKRKESTKPPPLMNPRSPPSKVPQIISSQSVDEQAYFNRLRNQGEAILSQPRQKSLKVAYYAESRIKSTSKKIVNLAMREADPFSASALTASKTDPNNHRFTAIGARLDFSKDLEPWREPEVHRTRQQSPSIQIDHLSAPISCSDDESFLSQRSVSESNQIAQEVSEDKDQELYTQEPQPDPKQTPKCLEAHLKAYLRSSKAAQAIPQGQLTEDAMIFLMDNKIQAVKYNYSLEDKVQDYSTYKCELSLSKDGKHFKVDIFKPIINLEDNLAVDEDLLGRASNRSKAKSINKQDTQYQIKRSSASCRVDEIEGITLGAADSRFWMFRKHINSMPARDVHKVPFYAWECLTLHLKHRSLNLVIRNEKEMRILLRFLVYSLKTIDGQKNSALPIIDSITALEAKEAELDKKFISSEFAVSKLRQEVEHRVLAQTLTGLKMLIIRNKISFEAHLKRQTVLELFFRTILKTVYYLADNGVMKVNRSQDKAFDEIFNPQTREGKIGLRFMVMSHVISALKIENEGGSKAINTAPPLTQQQLNPPRGVGQPEKKGKYKSMNQAADGFIRKYFQKDEVIEILRDVPQANKNADQFEHWSFKRFFDYKINLKSVNVLLKRIRLFTALGLMKDLLYLKIMLRRIELLKEKLILEVEQGKEVYIDRDLSLDRLPPSFRFYDFILRFVSENVAEDRKEYYGLKKGLNKQLHSKYNANYFTAKMGEEPEEEKLVYRVKLDDNGKSYEIDHLKSEHTMDVQRSKYVSIDNDMRVRANQVNPDPPKTIQQQRNNPQDVGNVKYSLQRHVAQNQHDFLKFKCTYASKQAHVKSQGQKLQIMNKIDAWVEQVALPQIVAKADPPLDFYLQEKLKKNILRIAEDLLASRRSRHRTHVFEKLKELFLSQQDSEFKSISIDKIISYDHRYFDSVTTEQQEEFNQIQRQHKRVERRISLRRESMLLLDGKQADLASLKPRGLKSSNTLSIPQCKLLDNSRGKISSSRK